MEISAKDFMAVLAAVKGTFAALHNDIPMLTKEDVDPHDYNTLALIELRDDSLEHLTSGYYRRIFRAAWNLFILNYKDDQVYRRYINYVLKKWQEKPWRFPTKQIEHSFWRHE